MKDLLLKATVGASLAKDRYVDNARDMVRKNREEGDIVQTIIIIAMFVLICMVVGGILYTAINSQAEKVSDCITSSNTGACTNFDKKK